MKQQARFPKRLCRCISLLLVLCLCGSYLPFFADAATSSIEKVMYNSYDQYLANYYIQYSMLDYQLNNEKLPYRTFVDDMSGFSQIALDKWLTATMGLGDETTYSAKVLEFYQFLIFDILYQDLAESTNLHTAETGQDAFLLSLSRQLVDLHTDLKMETPVTEENVDVLLDELLTLDCLSILVDSLDVISKYTYYTQNLEALSGKLYMLTLLQGTSEEVCTILSDVKKNASYTILQNACSATNAIISGALSEEKIQQIFTGNMVLEEVSKATLNKFWDVLVTSTSFGKGAALGSGVGKLVSNFLFSTDKVVETWYSMDRVYSFEKALKKALLSYISAYRKNPTVENARLVNRAAEMYFKTLSVGMGYAIEYAEAVNGSGAAGWIYKNVNKKEYEKIQTSLTRIKSCIDSEMEFVNNYTYNAYLEEAAEFLDSPVEWTPTTCITTETQLKEDMEKLPHELFLTAGPTVTTDMVLTEDKVTYSNFCLKGGTLELNGKKLTVYGDFYMDGGELNLHGYLDIRGNLYQSGGDLWINGGDLKVAGDYYIASSKVSDTGEQYWDCADAEFSMYGGSAILCCDFYCHTYEEPDLSGGTMYIGEDFTYIPYTGTSNSGDYQPTDAHKIILYGPSAQTLDIRDNRFPYSTLDIRNPEGIIVKNYLSAYPLTSSLPEVRIESQNGKIGYMHMDVPQVTITGDVTLEGDKSNNGTLRMNGNSLTVNGDLLQTGELDLDQGALTVLGDYRIESRGCLRMQQPECSVTVYGDFFTESYQNHYGTLYAGTMYLHGDFTQAAGHPQNFYTSVTGTHTVVLCGDHPQTVSFGSGALRDSRFNILRLTRNFDQYTFSPSPCWVTLEGQDIPPDTPKFIYTISYDANGGEGAPESQDKYHNEDLFLSATVPVRDGYIFLGWAEEPDAKRPSTGPQVPFFENKDVLLYAVWKKDECSHTYGGWNTVTAPDCLHGGTEERICTLCGEPETRNVDPLGHTEIIDEAVSPSCTASGLTEGRHCEVCGEILIAQETIDALGHSFGDWTAADTPGIQRRTCESCGHFETRTVELPAPVVSAAGNADTGKPLLRWKPVAGAEKYRIYRSLYKTGDYTYLDTVMTAESLSEYVFTDTTAKAGSKYCYRVRAMAGKVYSPYAKTVARTCDLPKPAVQITGSSASGKPIVRWETVEGAQKYFIYRAVSSDGPFTRVKTAISARSYQDLTAEPGTEYFYKVKAIHANTDANSVSSGVLRRVCDLERPGLTIQLTSGGDPFLQWTKLDGAEKYRIYRADTRDGSFSYLGTSTTGRYADRQAVKGRTYYYKLRAIHANTSANSAYSSVRHITAE